MSVLNCLHICISVGQAGVAECWSGISGAYDPAAVAALTERPRHTAGAAAAYLYKYRAANHLTDSCSQQKYLFVVMPYQI